MKKYLLKASGIAMAVLLSASVFGQDTKAKSKNKGDGQEVIIITKGDKDAKVTVEVKDGEVTVNGKPIDEYKDDDITVRRSRAISGTRIYNSTSPFRGQTWSYDSDNDRAYLGVVTEENDKGARITDVTENSAAAKAGLKEGDIITKVDQYNVKDHDDLVAALRKFKQNDKATVTFIRDGKEQKETVTLGKYSYNFSMTAPRLQGLTDMHQRFDFENDMKGFYSFGSRGRLGIRAQDTEDGKGVKVLDVDDESPAGKAGIKENDIITEFDGKDIDSADKLADAARATKDKSSMSVKLTRDGRSQTVEIKIPKKLKTANL